MHSSSTIDDDPVFNALTIAVVLDPKPRGYDEALEYFHNAKKSWHEPCGYGKCLYGKAGYLLKMSELNVKRARVDVLRQVIPSFWSYDSFTQFYVVNEVYSLGLMKQAWELVANVYHSTPFFRVQSTSLWKLVRFAEKDESKRNRIRNVIARALESSPSLKQHKSLASASIIHYLAFCRPGDFSAMLELCNREHSEFSADGKILYGRIVGETPSQTLVTNLNRADTPDLLSPMLEALYLRSDTKNSLPSFANTLSKRRDLLVKYVPTKGTSNKEYFTYLMTRTANLNRRGLRLEKLLTSLFGQAGFATTGPFRSTGEQVDGFFEYKHQQYLIEAKWTRGKTSASEVYAFRGKVEGRFVGTRGLFISINGFSRDCQDALARGKSLNVLLIDGNDLYEALTVGEGFKSVLARKLREASRSGNVYATVDLRELLRTASFPGAISLLNGQLRAKKVGARVRFSEK